MQSYQIKIVALTALAVWIVCFIKAETVASADKPDFKVLIGDWVRPDGGYIVRVRDVNPDGSVDAEYFNPNKINIAEANVSMWKGFVKLFVKLQDKGYPGSTYTLYYFTEKDALAGFYYQAEIGQTFKVVFLRKHKQVKRNKNEYSV